MTGRYPQRTGITDYINAGGGNQPEQWNRNTRLLPAPYSDHLALEERTIAEELHDAGYATFFAGKWHLGGDGFLPTDQGFDVEQGRRRIRDRRGATSVRTAIRKLPDGPPGESLTLRLGDEACKFIEANRERPFFAYLSFLRGAHAAAGAEKLIKKYEAKAAAAKARWARVWTRGAQSKLRLVQGHPTYAAMIEEMDDAVGMVLDKLDELGAGRRTRSWCSRRTMAACRRLRAGSTSNLPLRAGKGWMYEGGIRVASIVRWPGVVTAGTECATPIISAIIFRRS